MDALSRRERQIMDIVYRRGRATAADVRGELPNAPSYSAVRSLLRILERKGHLRHHRERHRYVFLPTVSRDAARRSALRELIRTFFDDSPEQAVATLLDLQSVNLTDHELGRLAQMIDAARQEGR